MRAPGFNDAHLGISFGLEEGYETVIIEGFNPIISQGVEVDVWGEGGVRDDLISAELMNLSSSDPNDTALGIGARTVFISGLDGDYKKINEVVEMNGTTNAVTANSYLRVFSLVVKTAGSSLRNEGVIKAISANSVTVQSSILSNVSMSKGLHYTVPSGKILMTNQIEFTATKTTSGQLPSIQANIYTRNTGSDSPWINHAIRKIDTAVLNQLIVFQPISNWINEKTDFKVTAITDENNTAVVVRYYGITKDIK